MAATAAGVGSVVTGCVVTGCCGVADWCDRPKRRIVRLGADVLEQAENADQRATQHRDMTRVLIVAFAGRFHRLPFITKRVVPFVVPLFIVR